MPGGAVPQLLCPWLYVTSEVGNKIAGCLQDSQRMPGMIYVLMRNIMRNNVLMRINEKYKEQHKVAETQRNMTKCWGKISAINNNFVAYFVPAIVSSIFSS